MRTFNFGSAGRVRRKAPRSEHVRTDGGSGATKHILRLQRTAGNAAVAQLLAGDDQEQSPVHSLLAKGGGSPLPAKVRKSMEKSFGADFSDVKVHSDGEAATSAKSMQAKAYTVGDDIVLGQDAASLESPEGRHTIAHELTHVVQQRSGPVDGHDVGDGIKVSDPSDRFKQQAEQVADQVDSGGQVGREGASAGGGGASVQRDDDEELGDDTSAAEPTEAEETEETEEGEAEAET